jgi:hypothetical protein
MQQLPCRVPVPFVATPGLGDVPSVIPSAVLCMYKVGDIQIFVYLHR